MPKTMMIDTPCQLLYDFSRIPDRSKVEMWVEGKKGDFVCLARVRTQNSLQIVEHDELFRETGGTNSAKVTLRSPKKYVVTIFINFRKDSTATLEFRLVQPGGGNHTGTPVSCTIKGKKDQEAPAQAFVLKTLQKSAS
jgi:hypothetical protein